MGVLPPVVTVVIAHSQRQHRNRGESGDESWATPGRAHIGKRRDTLRELYSKKERRMYMLSEEDKEASEAEVGFRPKPCIWLVLKMHMATGYRFMDQRGSVRIIFPAIALLWPTNHEINGNLIFCCGVYYQ